MSAENIAKIRIFVEDKLSSQSQILLPNNQTHYLKNVMRRKLGDEIRVFNGSDGEFIAEILNFTRKETQLLVKDFYKPQDLVPDIMLCFAPVKNVAMGFLVQKATELGVNILQPVITDHCVVNKVSINKLRSNAIEAAEQCERLSVPEINEPENFNDLIKNLEKEKRYIFVCDESGGGKKLSDYEDKFNLDKYAFIIGPEGGFSENELEVLRNKEYVTAINLGPRILRADTAALAALTCFQLCIGDWDLKPKFIN